MSAGAALPSDDRANNAISARATSLKHTLLQFTPWLNNPSVNEIAVNEPGTAFLWINGEWRPEAAPQLTLELLQLLGKQVSNYANQPFDAENPELSAYLPGGERIEMTMPPACPSRCIYLNVRKHTSVSLTLADFVKQGYFNDTRHLTSLTIDDEARQRLMPHLTPELLALWTAAKAGDWSDFFDLAVQHKQNIVVSGATGTGKTSFIRGLIELIPEYERLITVEDTPEMPLPNRPLSQHLFYKKPGALAGMTAKDALHAAMRKTPNRVLLAELRGDEAFYYMQGVLNSGHPGGITSVHANTPTDALGRIAMLIKASPEGMTMGLDDIMRTLHRLVHVVAQIQFEPGKGRFVPSIYFDPFYHLATAF